VAYVVTADLTARISEMTIAQLCDDERAVPSGTTTLDAAITANPAIASRVAAAIEDATAVINSYLFKVYDPTALSNTASDLVRSLGATLAVYFLYSRRVDSFDVPKSIEDKRTQALDMLDRLAKSEIELGTSAEVAADQSVAAAADSATVYFTDATLDRF
jgi:phage gp36-like protein